MPETANLVNLISRVNYLFIHDRIHVVHCFGGVVRHDRVEELGDDFCSLFVVRADEFGPLGLVEDLLDDQPGVILWPQDVQEQAVVVDALPELMAVGVLAGLVGPSGFPVGGLAEQIQRYLDRAVVHLPYCHVRDLPGDTEVIHWEISDNAVPLLGHHLVPVFGVCERLA